MKCNTCKFGAWVQVKPPCKECIGFSKWAPQFTGKTRATEMEWLEWFYKEANFGPAHDDVMQIMIDEFKLKTGKLLPKGYDCE